jgi:predicted small secreted protein
MRDPLINRSLLLAGLIVIGTPLAACHTVEGAGEDVESVGNAVSEAGEEAGEEIGEEAGEID